MRPTPAPSAKRTAIVLPLTAFLAALASTYLVLHVIGHIGPFVYLWPLTAVQLAFLLPDWSRRNIRIAAQLAGLAGVMLACFYVGMRPYPAIAIGVLNALDVYLVGAILSPTIRTFDDLKRTPNLVRFVIAATVAPILTGFLVGFPIGTFLRQHVLQSIATYILSDSLGLGVILPCLLFLRTGEYRSLRNLAPHLGRAIPLVLLFTAVASAVFWQTTNPFLFVVFPPMVLAILFLGLEGSVLTSLLLTVIGCVATAHGHGPLYLARVATPESRLLILQIFLWMSVATALPIGALLDERRRSARDASEARAVYQTLLEHAEDMIVLSHLDGSQRFVSAACQRLTGWSPEEYLAIPHMQTVHPDDRPLIDRTKDSMLAGHSEHIIRYRAARKKGGWCWVEAAIRAFYEPDNGVMRGYVGTIRDISGLKQIEEIWSSERARLSSDNKNLEELALTDTLTQLPNRRAFDDAVQEQIQIRTEPTAPGHRAVTRPAALLMIDVDNFKLYNDTYGHSAGDVCLSRIAQALRQRHARLGDLTARWGGEEFSVLLPGVDLAGAQHVAETILQSIRDLAIEHRGNPPGIATVSIGIAELTPPVLDDPNLWTQHADKALYLSKRAGRNRATVAISTPPPTIPAPIFPHPLPA
jgi:diguanylate cyclase (GGDEF)-like protein/PAS domain S-box-containing protein